MISLAFLRVGSAIRLVQKRSPQLRGCSGSLLTSRLPQIAFGKSEISTPGRETFL